MTGMLTVVLILLVSKQGHKEESLNMNPLSSMISNMKMTQRITLADKKGMKAIGDSIVAAVNKIKPRTKKL